MAIVYKNQLGRVIVSDDVLKKIASYAAKECYGLVGMASKNNSTGIVELLSFFDSNKGINLETVNNEVYIELFVIVQYGTKISVVADNLMERVKYDIETKTGIKVKKVSVTIQGVRVSK